MSGPVDRARRHLKRHPCPICGGFEEAVRGKGIRCEGFTSSDGWVHCARAELAGAIDQNEKTGMFPHRPTGLCKCGSEHAPGGESPDVEAVYTYTNERGNEVFQVVRKRNPKKFLQRRPDGQGRYIYRLEGLARVLYRLPRLIAADPEETVYIVEGEKDVAAAESLGLVATCNPGGALKWTTYPELAEQARTVLAGRHVVIIADDDSGAKDPRDRDKGIKHARQVATALTTAASIRYGVLPEHDLADFVAAGGTRETLEDLVQVSFESWAPSSDSSSPGPAPDENDAAEPDMQWTDLSHAGTGTLPGVTVGHVLDEWLRVGPVIHEPTGIDALDAVTGGGPVYGTRWALLGAPDAGKTALLTQIGDVLAQRGVFVGFLAVDEEPSDLVTRFAQRIGYARAHCEERDPEIVQTMRERLEKLPLRFFGVEHTIESAAADLHAWALSKTPKGQRVKCFLAIDSIQTVTCEAARRLEEGGRVVEPRALVTANCVAARSVASRYQLIALFTSEMSRSGYKDKDAQENVNDMAIGKESGSIEYVARVQLSLRSVKGKPDTLELVPVKNKHGRSGDSIFLEIDRSRQTIVEVDAPVKAKAADKDAASIKSVQEDAAKVAVVLAYFTRIQGGNVGGGIGLTKLRPEMRARHGSFGHNRTDAALAALGRAAVEVPGARTSKPLFLDGSKVSQAIFDLIPVEDRADVLASRPPSTLIDAQPTTITPHVDYASEAVPEEGSGV